MTLSERIEKAFESDDAAAALRSLVLELSQQGLSKADIYRLFEQFLIDSRKNTRHSEGDEDMLLDVMDALTGHCHPSARLLAEDEAG